MAGNPRLWIHLIMALRFRPTNSPALGGLSNSLMNHNYLASEKDEGSVTGESVATQIRRSYDFNASRALVASGYIATPS
jgi:hypothetical protein